MICCLLSLLGSALAVIGSSQPAVEYLSDLLDRFITFQQGWGELGVDTCAHAPGQTPLPMRIGDKPYSKGLGHHAPGEIMVDLNGEYALFEAEVGVQWQEGTSAR
ncbi:MAG: NPCBM/NEW2 domain-containing protein [Armatimonadota bacterium]